MGIRSLSGCLGPALLLLLVSASWGHAQGSATKILDNGSTATRIDLLFIGSGFTAGELDSYRTYVAGNLAKMLSVNWFTANQTKFNAWRIDAVSPQSGVPLDDGTIFNLAGAVPYDILIVIHNSLGEENANKPYIELFKTSHNYVVLAHELGHKIGRLGDEYYNAGTCTGLSKMLPNIHDKNSNEKWSDLISTPPFQGARYCAIGLWRPSSNSIMMDPANTPTFDAVGMKAMDLGAGKLLGTVESAEPSLTVSGVAEGQTRSGAFTATATASDASGIERVEFYFAKAGDTSKSIKIDRSAPYDVTVDTTQYSNGQYYLDVFAYDRNWNYSRRTILFNIENAGQASLNVPLYLRETAGVARVQEPCSTGVPLPLGLVQNADALALYNSSGNAVPAQFKVLERWNSFGQDRSVKWLLVTFLADVPASGTATYYLRFGTNPLPVSPASVHDAGDAFVMGGQRFMKNFSAPFALTLISADGQSAHRAEDLSTIQWTVVESGPVRACIKAESLTEPGKFGFIAWLYAFAGQSRWDITLVLKNTPRTPRGPFYFRDFSISWQGSGTAYSIGGDSGTIYSGNLSPGDRIYIYQDSSGTDRWQNLGEYGDGTAAYVLNWDDSWRQGIPSFRGFRMVRNGITIATGNHASGFASLGGNYLLVRDFWQNFPASLELADGRIIAHLLSDRWTGHGGIHWLDDLQRKAWDVSFRTSGSADSIKAFNVPLVAHCGLNWYRTTDVLGYISTRYAEQPPNATNLGQLEYNWVNYGGNWTDRIRRRYHWYLMNDFVRTGDPYHARRVFLAMRHSSGMTPLWLDSYSYPNDAALLFPYTYCSPARNQGAYTPVSKPHGYMPWNPEHSLMWELFDGYRLWGDPLALDAINKVGVYLQFYVDYRESRAAHETRVDATPMLDLCQIYRLTESNSILASINKYLGIMWNTINKTRGYYAPNAAGLEKPFMIATLIDGLIEAYDITRDQRANDMILMLTNYVMNEAYANKCVLYEVPIDPAARDAALAQARLTEPGACNSAIQNTNVQQMSRALAWCYLKTRDAKYKAMLDELVQGAVNIRYFNAMTGYLWMADWGALPDYVYEVGVSSLNPSAPRGLRIIK